MSPSQQSLANVSCLSVGISECLIGFVAWDEMGEQTDMVSALTNVACPKEEDRLPRWH